MTPIADVLQPDHVRLRLSAKAPSAAIEEVLAALEGDERVRDFAALRAAVRAQPAPAIAENGVAFASLMAEPSWLPLWSCLLDDRLRVSSFRSFLTR